MLPTENPIIPPSIEPLEELSEILARGALRLFLSRSEKSQDKRLKELDLFPKESNELNVQLTATEKKGEAG